jgi:hypothetical protein
MGNNQAIKICDLSGLFSLADLMLLEMPIGLGRLLA